jgi:hypothetical protein
VLTATASIVPIPNGTNTSSVSQSRISIIAHQNPSATIAASKISRISALQSRSKLAWRLCIQGVPSPPASARASYRSDGSPQGTSKIPVSRSTAHRSAHRPNMPV